MDTATLTLPKTLIDAYAERARREGRSADELMRDALEAHAQPSTIEPRASRAEAAQVGPSGAPDDERPWAERRVEFYAAMGIDAAALPDWVGMVEHGPDDGYDSSNIRDWIRATWTPE